MDNEVRLALTRPDAWRDASQNLRAKCLEHIEDAQKQVIAAADKVERQVMLARLPTHIRDIVRERLAALWVGDGWGYVIYATDNSEDGYHDACVASEGLGEIRRLPLSDAIWVVTQKAPE